MKMREEDVVSSSVSRMAASTSQLIASVASRCEKNLATLRSCARRPAVLGAQSGLRQACIWVARTSNFQRDVTVLQGSRHTTSAGQAQHPLFHGPKAWRAAAPRRALLVSRRWISAYCLRKHSSNSICHLVCSSEKRWPSSP